MKVTKLFFALLFFSHGALFSAELPIIPKPNQAQILNGSFALSQIMEIKSDELPAKSVNQLADYLSTGSLKIYGRIMTTEKNAVMRLKLDKADTKLQNDEAYRLVISPSEINATARTETGLFYALQTLMQLANANASSGKIPCVDINDYPRFPYRGLHLDVSRHFFNTDFIKKQLDMMAYYKLNKFHWHLTDGPGWRLEIKKYPLLTQVAAWRTHETWKEWWDTKPRQYVDITSGQKAFGGFYTQEEAREIVRYAAERHITVIPEIEMPGHSEEVLAAYPHLACTGKPYTQSEFCIGNDSTFTFLEDVLTEVMAIFPSKYIHIGGDEADKKHWKECPKCQARIKKEGLKNEEELQSYLIKRIEKFLIKNDRKLLGWDEILEGGLAPEATVMSWRGEDGGIHAAKSGHDVVMTPGSHCYFDSYQATPSTQPEAIGGFLPIEKVYSYNPVPNKLTPEEAKHILGAQANLWTEYIPTPEHAEYMIYPRLLALAEVTWTLPEYKNWNNFKKRVNAQIPFLQWQGYHPFTLSKEPIFIHKADNKRKAILVEMSTEFYPAEIRYTLNGKEPNCKSAIYNTPIPIKNPTTVKARVFQAGKSVGETVSEDFVYHKAIGKKIAYAQPYSPQYPAGGDSALVDGYRGGLTYGDGRWQGFINKDMDVTIDLGKLQSISYINAKFMQITGPWVWVPAEAIISVSKDGKNFVQLTNVKSALPLETSGLHFQDFGWKGKTKARYIRYQTRFNDKKGFIFTDEIVVW